jgi:putative ABC transport system permease protein
MAGVSSHSMSWLEVARFAAGGVKGHGLRTGLSLLGVTIGVTAVIILTALGEGAKRYVIEQFASLGTNLVIVLPGKTETTGSFGIGGVPNDLTLEDAQAIARLVPQARRVAPLVAGTEELSYGERRRQLAVMGTTRSMMEVRDLVVGRGDFLPDEEMFRGSSVAVLGHKAARELFDAQDPIGKVVRIGGWRMRVVGVLAEQGTKLGVNFDDVAIIPVQTGMKMLNRSSLFRIIVQVWAHSDLDAARDRILALLTERHEEEDVTILTQDAVISTFGDILNTLTLVVAAIGAISLSVAGIGIMNVMLVSVSERTREIGLLKAVGASRGQILGAFLTEAAFISSAGGLLGLALGWFAVRVLVGVFPMLPASPPSWAVGAALGVSLGVGLGFGFLPARRATRLDPVAALGHR